MKTIKELEAELYLGYPQTKVWLKALKEVLEVIDEMDYTLDISDTLVGAPDDEGVQMIDKEELKARITKCVI